MHKKLNCSRLEFQLLNDAEMLSQSLAALVEYRDSDQNIAHQNVAAWADSLGTDNELPCPQ